MWAGARCWIWAGSGPELKSMWPRFEPVLLYLVYSWLTLGLPLASLWPQIGKTGADCPSAIFFTVCGPEQGVVSVAELKSVWPRFGPVLLFWVYLWLTLGLPLNYLWPKFGKQERTAKCHYSSQYVGRSKVLDLGWIWARIKINVAQI